MRDYGKNLRDCSAFLMDSSRFLRDYLPRFATAEKRTSFATQNCTLLKKYWIIHTPPSKTNMEDDLI
jgi:hypothetical protein